MIAQSLACVSKLDIHEFERQFARAWRNMESSKLSERNKTLIRDYCDACLVRHVCGRVWLSRALIILKMLGELVDKDFDRLSRADLEALISLLLRRQPPYRPETISTYKRVLRRFMSYVLAPDAFPRVRPLPPEIAWISTALRRHEHAVIRRSDLLTPHDVANLVAAVHSDRDRALISLLWEAGARIGEIGNLHLGSVMRARIGYTLDLTGKTGTRTVLVVSAAPYLARWISRHPHGALRDAPLWIVAGGKQMAYWTIAKMVKTAFRAAGIDKPAHPHIFRHSRVTYVLANSIMNEQQAKLYFGWRSDSRLPGQTYAHLIAADIDVAVLRENGFAPIAGATDLLRPRMCRACGELNPPRLSASCVRCGTPVGRRKRT